MHAVRTGVGNVSEKTTRQLTLEIQVVLLEIPVLLHGVAGIREIILRQGVLGDIRQRVATGHCRNDIRAYRRDPSDIGSLVKWPRTNADERSIAKDRLGAGVRVEGCSGAYAMVVRVVEVRGSGVKNVVVGVGVERHVIRDEENPVTAANYSFGVHRIGESKSRQHFLVRERQVVPAAVSPRLDQENIARASASRHAAAARNGRIGGRRIEVTHLVVPL